jgi:hypothetical protein
MLPRFKNMAAGTCQVENIIAESVKAELIEKIAGPALQ